MYLNESKARVENIDAGLVERRSAREERSQRTLGARQIEYQLIDCFHLSKYKRIKYRFEDLREQYSTRISLYSYSYSYT